MLSLWLEMIQTRISRWCSQGLGRAWVVAVSGGSDSVALLRILHQLAPGLELRLSVAHLDHGVRGEASRADAEFVGGLAGALELPFDLGHWRPARAGHFESDARQARYDWLTAIAKARGATVVAAGHTRDDQAETILHRIVRGTGVRGLRGMLARRRLDDSVVLARPLLAVTRTELRAFLDKIGQSSRVDLSNTDCSHTRARIRQDLLPKLASEYNPHAAEAIVRLGELAAASERSLYRFLAKNARAAIVSADALRAVLRREMLAALPIYSRTEVLRLVWRRVDWPELGMDSVRWRRLALLVERSPTSISAGGGVQATTDAHSLILERLTVRSETAPATPLPLEVPGSTDWGSGRLFAMSDPDAPTDERVDRDRLAFPLCVRAAMPGDRFEPLGMHGRSTPLNDFFRGRQVPREQRRRIPLVCDEVGIVWVTGHRIAHRVRLTETTQRTVGLRWEEQQH